MIHSADQFDNINFNGGNLSSDGGSILLASYIDNKCYMNDLSTISYDDNRKTPIHSNNHILQQMVERCCLGYFNQKE